MYNFVVDEAMSSKTIEIIKGGLCVLSGMENHSNEIMQVMANNLYEKGGDR